MNKTQIKYFEDRIKEEIEKATKVEPKLVEVPELMTIREAIAASSNLDIAKAVREHFTKSTYSMHRDDFLDRLPVAQKRAKSMEKACLKNKEATDKAEKQTAKRAEPMLKALRKALDRMVFQKDFCFEDELKAILSAK